MFRVLRILASVSLCLLVVLGIFSPCRAQIGEEKVLRVSKMAKPPVVDGTINEDEWSDACAVTGFRGALFATAYPESLRMVWHLGYDDKNLYLAMNTVYPTSITLKADAKAADQDNEHMLIEDDHLELEFTPHSRRQATMAGYGFYKMFLNPRGVFSDTWYFNGTPGNEQLWSSSADVKCSITPGRWQMEMAFPLESMKIKKADDTELIVQLSRAVRGSGWYFASMSGGMWTDFDYFYRLILDPRTPTVQFLQHGDIVNGNLDALLRVKGTGTVSVSAHVADRNGKVLFEESKPLPLDRTTWQTTNFKTSNLPALTEDPKIPSGDERGANMLYLSVRQADTTLYSAAIPFIKFTPDYVERYYTSWLNSRPTKADYKIETAYAPSTGKVRAKADLDVFGGLPGNLSGAKRMRVDVVRKAGGKRVASGEFPINNLQASGIVNAGDLSEGAYETRVSLLDAKGTVLDTRSEQFARKHYPWENNAIGKERVVIPPYRPLKVNGTSIETVCQRLSIGCGGLLQGLSVQGEDILRAPVRMEGTINGKAVTWSTGAPRITVGKGKAFPAEFDKYRYTKNCPKVSLNDLPNVDGYDAEVEAKSTIGELSARVQGLMDYDGWYRVRLEIDPGAKPVKVDNLDLAFPMWEKADVMSAGRGEFVDQRIPNGEGVVWESRNFLYHPKWFNGSWVPTFYVGNGGRGLWVIGESDEGWVLDDNKSSFLIERRNGQVTLRMCLVNTPTTITKKRVVEFAMQATPAKPVLPNGRHITWGYPEPSNVWMAFGWRLYGYGGIDFYLPTDDDYRDVGEVIHNPDKFGCTPVTWEPKLAPEKPIVMYSSHHVISMSLPELETYRGEWLGKNVLQADRDYFVNHAMIGKGRNFTRKFLWDTPEKCSEVPAYWSQSLVDCYIWYHKKLIELADTNGTFFDNLSIVFSDNVAAGLAYVRDDGSVQAKSNMFARRQLTKRLHTTGWLAGKPPYYVPNGCGIDTSFAEANMPIEGIWYVYSKDGDFIDSVNDMDFIRAACLSRGIPMLVASSQVQMHPYGQAGTNPRPTRSLFAVIVLNDLAIDHGRNINPAVAKPIMDLLDREIGFFSPENQAKFHPWWDNAGVFHFSEESNDGARTVEPKQLFGSVYTRSGKAAVWLVNTGEKDATSDIWLDDQALLGKQAARLRDAETGETMVRVPDGKGAKTGSTWAHVWVRPHDFRMLVLE